MPHIAIGSLIQGIGLNVTEAGYLSKRVSRQREAEMEGFVDTDGQRLVCAISFFSYKKSGS